MTRSTGGGGAEPAAGTLRISAPAKVNLVLSVRSKRPDGFHEVDTLMLALDRCDTLELAARDTGPAEGAGRVRLSVSGPAYGPDVPTDASNLACRAVEAVLALAERRGVDAEVLNGCLLDLVKRVPTQAGLGGASSDAAAAALAAADLAGIDRRDPELGELVAELGSDCAFFLVARETGVARCTGRGERVEPLARPAVERAFCVFTPGVSCPTAEVYAALRAEELSREEVDFERLLSAPLDEARGLLSNALEPAALRVRPALAAWRARLDASGGEHFRLCGSGSSFFGMFSDAASARAFLEDQLTARNARDHGLRAAFIARGWSPGR